jgi:hypothetical protein
MLIDDSAIETQNLIYLNGSPQALGNIETANLAIDVLRAFAEEPSFNTDDDTTLLRLGIRAINDAGACGKCALAGYYQQAIAHIRDIIEIGFLLDLFRRDAKNICEWRTATERERKEKFAPVKLRMRLDELDGRSDKKRAEAYSFYSHHGTHPTPELAVISPDQQTKVGPFPHEQYVTLLTFDMAKWLCATTGYAIKCFDIHRVTSPEKSLALTQLTFGFSVAFLRLLNTSHE